MAMLPSPLIPDANQWIAARQAGYEQGEAQRRRNLLLEAGALAAASPAMSAPAVAPAAAGGMNAYSNAISSIESGGRYDAIGPATRSGDRAYGKYQVMGANIPAWTKKHLGRELTPQQFLADKDAQEKVFAGEFGGYVQKYGNPQDAASMWFSGRPAAQGAGRNDGYTSQPEYLRRFNAALGGGAPAPVQTVQARPLDPDAPLRNASNALLRGGELQAGLGLQNQLFERSEKARAQAEARRKEGEALFGELALRADTPEKWARAVEMARQGGLNVAGLEDFSARDFVMARAGKSMDYMSAGKNGIYNKTLGRYEPRDPNAPADAESLSKNATWVQDAEGNYHIAQLNESGDPRIAKFPEGIKVLPPTFTVDAGLTQEVRARPGGGAMNSIPKNVAGEARQKEIGKGQGERTIAKPAANSSMRNSLNGLKRLSDEAFSLKGMEGVEGMTGVIQGSGMIPTVRQNTADAEAKLTTLKSQIAFSVLQAMRDASKTGGALGAVSDKEMTLLENNLAALEKQQSTPAFKASLDRIVEYAQGAMERLRAAYRDTYGQDFDEGGAGEGAPRIDLGGGSGGFKVLRVR